MITLGAFKELLIPGLTLTMKQNLRGPLIKFSREFTVQLRL